jgi:hypothetical protein
MEFLDWVPTEASRHGVPEALLEGRLSNGSLDMEWSSERNYLPMKHIQNRFAHRQGTTAGTLVKVVCRESATFIIVVGACQ